MNIRWLCGFIEGEGSFAIKAAESPSSIIGYYIQPRFSIGLSRDDIGVMYKIKDYLENKLGLSVGFLDRVKQGKTDSCRIYLYKWRDIDILIDNLLPFMKTKKKKKVLVMKEAIDYYKKFSTHPTKGKQIWTKERFFQMMEYVEKLQSLRSESRPRKYSIKFFRDLWNK